MESERWYRSEIQQRYPKLAMFEARDTFCNSSFLASIFSISGCLKIKLKKPHPSLMLNLNHIRTVTVWIWIYVWVPGENHKVFICFIGIWLLMKSLRWWSSLELGFILQIRQAHYASFLVGAHRSHNVIRERFISTANSPWSQALNMFE